jgi:hypothetical protein
VAAPAQFGTANHQSSPQLGFSAGLSNWAIFGQLNYALNSGELRFDNSAVQSAILQNTHVPVTVGTPVELEFLLGNNSTVWKRAMVILHAQDWSDLSVCAFMLRPGQPLSTYAMETYTTGDWSAATVSWYARGTPGGNGYIRLDNLKLRPNPSLTTRQTVCYERQEYFDWDDHDQYPNLVLNGGFDNGLTSWNGYGHVDSRVRGGVLEMQRLPGSPAGVVLQSIPTPIAEYTYLQAEMQFGNTSDARMRVTVLLHTSDFSNVGVCTFWLPPHAPLQPYTMTIPIHQSWGSVGVSLYPATTGGWIQVDDVSVRERPLLSVRGSRCNEPGSIPPDVHTSSLGIGIPPAVQFPIPPVVLPSGERPLMATPVPLSPENDINDGEGQLHEELTGQ